MGDSYLKENSYKDRSKMKNTKLQKKLSNFVSVDGTTFITTFRIRGANSLKTELSEENIDSTKKQQHICADLRATF